jgi:hypothetical protein
MFLTSGSYMLFFFHALKLTYPIYEIIKNFIPTEPKVIAIGELDGKQ